MSLTILLSSLGFNNLYKVFESSPPSINFENLPAGLGKSPTVITAKILDNGAGLKSVSALLVQDNQSLPIMPKTSAKGAHQRDLLFHFTGANSELKEGTASLTITATDLSSFANTTTKQVNFLIDYESPNIQVLPHENEVLAGSAQLLFVRASDNQERLEVGLKAGDNIFRAFPARALDRAFDDPTLYVIPYALPLGFDPEKSLHVYAEDLVGNSIHKPLKLKITPRLATIKELELTDALLRTNVREVIETNKALIDSYFTKIGGALAFQSKPNTPSRDQEYFKLITQILIPLQEQIIRKKLEFVRFDRYWFKALTRPPGELVTRFATAIHYKKGQLDYGQLLSEGYEVELPRTTDEAIAIGDGIVLFSGQCGHLRRCVIVDHGLGLTSIYGALGSANVATGSSVKAGQPVGLASVKNSGRNKTFLLQLRIQGVPVELKDWWSPEWFARHITGNTNKAKRSLGIPIRVEFR